MTTTTPPGNSIDSPAEDYYYNALLISAAEAPLVGIANNGFTLRFAFDDQHDWLDYHRYATMLDNDDDRDLIADSIMGGRLLRPVLMQRNAHEWLTVYGAVKDPVEWTKMLATLDHDIARIAQARRDKSLDDLAYYFEELLSAMCFAHDDPSEMVIEVGRGDGDEKTATFTHAMVEDLLELAAGTAVSFEVTYPGAGNALNLVIVSEPEPGAPTVTENWTIEVPATPTVAELLSWHYDRVEDPEYAVPVLATLNALDSDRAAALYDLALEQDPDAYIYDDHPADVWTLLRPAT